MRKLISKIINLSDELKVPLVFNSPEVVIDPVDATVWIVVPMSKSPVTVVPFTDVIDRDVVEFNEVPLIVVPSNNGVVTLTLETNDEILHEIKVKEDAATSPEDTFKRTESKVETVSTNNSNPDPKTLGLFVLVDKTDSYSE